VRQLFRFVSIAMKNLHVITCVLLLMTSCYKEVINVEPDADSFKLLVTPEKQDFIYNSRDTSYTIEDPELSLFFNDQELYLEEIRVRGNSALRYQRKSYAVFLNEPLNILDRYEVEVKRLSRFKLLAMAMDYTYMENRVAFGILESVGAMPLFYKFVEFKINDNTQGVYLLVEDPEQYYKEIGSEYILRRGYNHSIEDRDYEPSEYYKPIEEYENRFREIYSSLQLYQGEELYNEISQRLDLEQYFRKMGIDYLLQNGDYTDELYLYAMVKQDTIRFHPVPWDYDDVFAKNPHEIGRSWGMGTVFGTRYYETIQDVYDDVGHTLVYSIEDDLDYAIARDPFLYAKYEEAISRMFNTLDKEMIDEIFNKTTNELSTFYNSFSVIEQSMYDQHKTTKELWIDNMREKQIFIEDRLGFIQDWLNGAR